MFGRLTSMKMMVRLVKVKIEGEEEKRCMGWSRGVGQRIERG